MPNKRKKAAPKRYVKPTSDEVVKYGDLDAESMRAIISEGSVNAPSDFSYSSGSHWDVHKDENGDLVRNYIDEKEVRSILSSEEREQFLLWLEGGVELAPEILAKITTNLNNKLQISMGYGLISLQRRNQMLMEFIDQAEAAIFSPTRVQTMSMSDLSVLYHDARNAFFNNMEFQRKIIQQNRNMLKDMDSEQSAMVEQLASLPQSVLRDLIDKLKKGKGESNGG